MPFIPSSVNFATHRSNFGAVATAQGYAYDYAMNQTIFHPANAAIAAYGSAAAMARALGVKPPTVHQWRVCKRPIPPRLARRIAAQTGISVESLCPHVFAPDR